MLKIRFIKLSAPFFFILKFQFPFLGPHATVGLGVSRSAGIGPIHMAITDDMAIAYAH